MTDTLTMSRPDLVVAPAVAPPCEFEHDPDPAPPADWIVWMQPCGCPMQLVELWCDDCLQRVLATNRDMLCTGCGWLFMPGRTVIQSTERI